MNATFEQAAQLINEADSLLITAGAGMGVDQDSLTSAAKRDSGKPTRPSRVPA